ncbi:MAG: hypothetical protein KatS3mg124_0951 [Porticoccaceae bacterium]|nr:MAG: hypothetical protein KatS3mg124_0951 [Porticoccaceae bacterium]
MNLWKGFFLWGIASWAAAADLVVEVAGIDSPEGRVRLWVYDDPAAFAAWKGPVTLQEARAVAARVRLRVINLPAGRYAVRLHHDRDGDGEVDRRYGRFAAEGLGVSGALPPAKADFASAAFDHRADADSILRIQLHACRPQPRQGWSPRRAGRPYRPDPECD